jgi:hypothetical protein
MGRTDQQDHSPATFHEYLPFATAAMPAMAMRVATWTERHNFYFRQGLGAVAVGFKSYVARSTAPS